MKKSNLSDDVWFEIFLHLPLASIFKSRCVSKVWFLILSNPNFIKQWYNKLSLHPWALLGHSSPPFSKRLFAFPNSHSKFLPQHHQNGFPFGFLNKKSFGLVLASSNGLFLCATHQLRHTTYYVCNPLTQKWIVLPPSPGGSERAVTGFVCNDECSGSYKVIRVLEFKVDIFSCDLEAAKEIKVEIFSSDSGEWVIYDVSCPGDVTWDNAIQGNVVTHNGVLYWFQRKNSEILAVCVDGNTNRGECRLIHMPDRPMYGYCKFYGQCIGESEGMICYASYQDAERSLSVWVLDGDWHVLCTDITLQDMLAEMGVPVIGGAAGIYVKSLDVQVLGFNPFDKNVVILGYKKYIVAFNTRTRAYEHLCRPSFGDNAKSIVPHISVLAFSAKLKPTMIPPICR